MKLLLILLAIITVAGFIGWRAYISHIERKNIT